MTHSGEPTSEHIISKPQSRAPLQRYRNASGWPITITFPGDPLGLRNETRPITKYYNDLVARIKAVAADKLYPELKGAVSIESFHYFKVPPNPKDDLRAYHTNDRKPLGQEATELGDMVLKAILEAGLVSDPRQVWRLHVEKAYAPNPKTVIVLSPCRTM